MKSILFVSTATEHFDGPQFRSLMTTAAMNNAVKDVTGVLGYNGMNFIQLAEGPDDAIDDCMDRILRDKRHFGVIPIKERRIQKRECHEWGVASGSLYLNPLRPESFVTNWKDNALDPDTRSVLASFSSLQG